MIQLPLKWKRRRPSIWCMDAMREDMAVVEVTEEDMAKWRWEIRCGDP